MKPQNKAWFTNCIRFTLGTTFLLLCIIAQQAQAQSTQSNVIEEIMVTALKRSENIQDTAAAIQAFTAKDIEKIGVKSMRDYAKLVPNLYLVETQASNFAFINIRGVTQFRNTDPSVAVVIDGVLNTSPIGVSQELFDIEQIEVLKGPQGALYGRNSLGGAINIRTRQPTNEFEGFVRGGYGNGNAGKMQGSVSGPLIPDKLLGRVAVSYYDDNGFRNNITTGTNADASRNFSTRTKLLWLPVDDVTVDMRFSYSKDQSNAGAFVDTSPIFHETAPGSGVSLGAFIGAFPPGSTNFVAGPVVGGEGVTSCLPLAPGVANCPGLQVPGAAFNVGNFNRSDIPPQTNLLGIDNRDIYSASVLVNWDIDGLGRLTSVSSWDRLKQFARIEAPPRTGLAAAKNTQFRFSRAWSQELRFTSPDERRLRWLAGAYVVQTDTFIGTTGQKDGDGRDSLVDLVTSDPTIVQRCGNPGNLPDPSNVGNCVLGFEGDGGDNIAYAFFAQIDFDLTEKLTLTFSGRFDRDERTQIVGTPDAFLTPQQKAAGFAFGLRRDANFESLQPKGTIKWAARDNLMLYATYAEGFRSGLFNRPAIQQLADALRPTTIPPIVLGIENIAPKQTSKGFEGGFKFDTPNGRFVINGSGFYTRIDNYQTFSAVTLGTVLSQVIIPVDKVKIWGGEFDASFLVAEGLSLQTSFGYTDSKVLKDSSRRVGLRPRDSVNGLVGNEAPSTPEYTLNVNIDYGRPITVADTELDGFFRFEYQRIGQMWDVIENFSQRDELDLFNLRGGFEIADSWRFEGWVKNLTNKNYFVEDFNPAGFSYHGKLRQYGFEFTKRF